MMRPSRLSASYASLLPALNRLGYRADVREASVYGSRCVVVVSGAPTTRVLNDGSWERDDGMEGSDPTSLLGLYREERVEQAVRHLARHDLKGVACDILIAAGIPVGVILDAVEHDGGLAVSYRRVEGVPEDTVIHDWTARAKAAPALLEENVTPKGIRAAAAGRAQRTGRPCASARSQPKQARQLRKPAQADQVQHLLPRPPLQRRHKNAHDLPR